jgi:hypothetical protein
VFSVTQTFFRYSLLAYLLEHDGQSQTIGDLFRHLEEETGKLTFRERLWQYLVTFLKTVLNTLAQFCDPGPQFRAYLDAITNTFNCFSPNSTVRNLSYQEDPGILEEVGLLPVVKHRLARNAV